MVSLNGDSTFNEVNPLILNAKADNETYMFHEILRMPDKHEFVQAMVKELEDHSNRKHWIALDRHEMKRSWKCQNDKNNLVVQAQTET